MYILMCRESNLNEYPGFKEYAVAVSDDEDKLKYYEWWYCSSENREYWIDNIHVVNSGVSE